MACITCTSDRFRSITRAMAKAASAKFRQIGVGETSTDWTRRAAICERCPMKVIDRGTSYCGKPFLQQIDRDVSLDGCGCPTREKAKSPDEHCPVTLHFQPSSSHRDDCDCKWCASKAVIRD